MDEQQQWSGNAPDERPRQPRQVGSSVIQAMGFSLFGLLILVIDVLALGPVVDYFLDLSTTFEIIDPSMQDSMQQMIFFGNWFYYIIFIIGAVFVIYPIIYTVMRHKYINRDTTMMNDESGW